MTGLCSGYGGGLCEGVSSKGDLVRLGMGIPLRSLRSASPFAVRKGTVDSSLRLTLSGYPHTRV